MSPRQVKSEPEVKQFDAVVGEADKNVSGLKIQVDHALVVDIFQCSQQLYHRGQYFCKRSSSQMGDDIRAFYVFHGEEKLTG
jgi:hypothetical protein